MLGCNPGVGLRHAVAELDTGRPTKVFFDLRIIAVATIHAFGSGEIMTVLKLYAGNLLDQLA
jgi:hypothetical protein